MIPLALLAFGCGSPGGDAGPVETKEAPTGEAAVSGELEVAAFKGGYGIDFYQGAAKEFEEMNKGLKIEVWGEPRVWDKLRPRIVAGDPPSLMFPGWGMDHWTLADEGQLMMLDQALDSKAYGGDQTWRETYNEGILKLGQSEGKQYVLPFYFSMMGWWYDPGVFERNGWTPPKTYAELLALCEKIKAKGIAPITFQGQYPYYMMEGMILPWVQSIGGMDALKAMQNLEPGAWKSPELIQAAKMILELRDKGYFLHGSVGLSHTESQTQFLLGKAAMIPCGTWLESEMKEIAPPGAQMRFMLAPAVEGGKGDPNAIMIGIEPWMVPSKAKNPDAAIAFFKYMTSLEKSKQFVRQKGTLVAIKGSEETELPKTLEEPARLFRESKTVWSPMYRQWYTAMQKKMEGALTSMLNGTLTAEQFADRCEQAAQEVREDSRIKKRKVE